MIEFTECETSGQLVGEGSKGQYWIDEQALSHLTLVTNDSAGINTKKLGAFNGINEAKVQASLIDSFEDKL